MVTRKKLTIGILGCGAVAYRWYLPGLSTNNPSYRIIAVCDLDIEKAKKAAKDFSVEYFCSSQEELLAFQPDIVVILTRHDDHEDHIRFFLSHNIHVYSEKPFARSQEGGKLLLQMAQERNVFLASAPQVMLSTRNIQVKKMLDEGVIGKVSFVRASCSNLGPAGRPDTDYDPEWFYQEGGSLSSLGIYGLSTLIWLFGKPVEVSCFETISLPERDVLYGPAKGKKICVTAPDNVAALFNFGNGCLAVFDGSYVVANPPPYDFEIHGSQGSLLVGGFGGPSSVRHCSLSRECQDSGPHDDCHLNWTLAWGVEDLVNAIQENRPPRASAEVALVVLEVMDAMKHSSKNRQAVKLL